MTTSDAFRSNRDNFCYRHPDRQSFVLCQRCMRTICPECQTQAAVGVICPECMREQRATQTSAQKKAERRWSRAPMAVGTQRPTATYAIIVITAAVFVLQLLIPAIEGMFAFNSAYVIPSIAFEPWRLFTAIFLHSSFFHIGLNMLALWMIGRSLEPLLGHGRFVALYLLSGLGGSVGVALIAPGTWVVGASGAVFGLLGALLVIGRHIGANITGILIVLGINLVIGFVPGYNIAWQAHVGGLVVGAVIGLVFARTRTRARQPLQIGLLVAIGVGLLALLAIPAVFYV
ncbi:rhomboid family intramembrane serine protease [Microbacterium sp.]|uniref:rhomboid family intramembrane serine protease n=1 Tax=unclassified Microbacterium TaxID=2609290 RepID=UPI002608A23B|nr:rhomboid family intramembrane serine protease [Microbacterium sp.]